MKIQKKFLALSLILAFAAGFCVHAIGYSINQKASQEAKRQQVADAIYSSGEIANSAGYFEGLHVGMSLLDGCTCGCPNCAATDSRPLSVIGLDDQNDDKSNEDQPGPAEPEDPNPHEERLPILMDHKGTWLDQNAEPMNYTEAKRFFSRNRAYAKVAVAINSLCVELQSDGYQYDLDRVSDWATEKPHDPDEYLDYEWILAEMEANYDYYLNDLLNLIGNEIDYENSPADRTATHIILEKMLEFRADDTYDEAINPHRKHDCEANGCNTQPTNTPPTQNPVLTSLPIVGDILALSDELTDADIVALLDAQAFYPTIFDQQHPNLYFDRNGRAHGTSDPTEEYYYADTFGAVYRLDSNTDIERIGESPLFDASLRGTYVGGTNRILK